jgi:hypothetical protein
MDGRNYAELAIMDLEQIHRDDVQRKDAWTIVRRWLDEHE